MQGEAAVPEASVPAHLAAVEEVRLVKNRPTTWLPEPVLRPAVQSALVEFARFYPFAPPRVCLDPT